ncbi:unnamed protein product [Echinostoma caproni]|uniref:Organic cation transporter protein n=1 Tax=Echinostoma caproni TaxID=27848 RepID=A0A183AVJ9_9TREM|nr:unnamed protein product [Echinostoma caproni]
MFLFYHSYFAPICSRTGGKDIQFSLRVNGEMSEGLPNKEEASTSAVNGNPVQSENPNQSVSFNLKDPDSPCGTFFPRPTIIVEKDKRLQCGLLEWRPRCLMGAGNIKAFLAAACFISCLQAAYSGYAASQVTTLEKRFAVGSSVMGAVNSFFEIGYIFSVVFVSYAGGRGHVPVWISCGLFVMSVGAVLWSLPHFIFREPTSIVESRTSEPICVTPSYEPNCTGSSCVTSPVSSSEVDGSVSGYAFLPIFFAAQMLIGGGSSPILTLAPPFIDDHVHPAKAPPMIGKSCRFVLRSNLISPRHSAISCISCRRYPSTRSFRLSVFTQFSPCWMERTGELSCVWESVRHKPASIPNSDYWASVARARVAYAQPSSTAPRFIRCS